MSYHTAVVVVLCSLMAVALAAWIAWLWRPPGRIARKLQPIRDLAREPLWRHESSTTRTVKPFDVETDAPEDGKEETHKMPSVTPPDFPVPERRA